ncbi:uncharacterized protein EAF01_002412 [Botrytis porri]|uniref:Uncharacterized protein n=1 Tax=Botrytis porri TaxID=87229 RepID=A0A4Z1KQ56_9HELO|nr:uncharacterized protein EAF01_002412 [Botrytis porri]KAF7910903.1 hypothetical protein EAF01_002412 [Botrytis porri]TGO83475.1 hypothetical protein BPOR_0641g00040 [Botrytis porri]
MCFTYQVIYGCTNERKERHNLFAHRRCELGSIEKCPIKVKAIELKHLFCEECLERKLATTKSPPYKIPDTRAKHLVEALDKKAQNGEAVLRNDYLKRQASFFSSCSMARDLHTISGDHSPFHIQELMHRRLNNQDIDAIERLAIEMQRVHVGGFANGHPYVYPVAAMLHKALLGSIIARAESNGIIQSCCKYGTHEPLDIGNQGVNVVVRFGLANTHNNERECGTCKDHPCPSGQSCPKCRCSMRRHVKYKGKVGSLVFVDSDITPWELRAIQDMHRKFYAEKAKPKGSKK